jgi:diguanylate cyclase (GGDEF)-like protein
MDADAFPGRQPSLVGERHLMRGDGPAPRPAATTTARQPGTTPLHRRTTRAAGMPGAVDHIITSVAGRLTAATIDDAARTSEQVLSWLVEYFDADAAFLRDHDRKIGASKLVAEWPPRFEVPHPDPMAVLFFADADPQFAGTKDSQQTVVVRPEPGNCAYLAQIPARHRPVPPWVALVPLMCGPLTTGVLGIVRSGECGWAADELAALDGIAALFELLRARVAAELKVRHLERHDELTGLPNRRALAAELGDRLRRDLPGPVAVLYLDLDRMKSVNEYFGRSAGDFFIRRFAERLGARVASRAMLARVGGDEFVLLPNHPMSADDAQAFAHLIQSMAGSGVAIRGELISRTVSIGVAVGMPGTDSCEDLLLRAGHANVAAKSKRNSRIAVATDDMYRAGTDRDDIDIHLLRDIHRDALVVHYLPEFDLRTGEVVATEALVRWQHPTRGLLLPDSFLGTAESIDLVCELDRWVLRTACAEFSRWRSNGLAQDVQLRVNVSPIQLTRSGYLDAVAAAIYEFGIASGSVCLEITERAMLDDIDISRATLQALKDIGVQIAIDDFGTGYSALSHLKSLPVDVLKIDASFVRDLDSAAIDQAIVRAIIGLAEAFGLQLVAEGVESAAAASTLLRYGCHRAQGFLLSGPLPGDAMEALLTRRRIAVPVPADRRPQA